MISHLLILTLLVASLAGCGDEKSRTPPASPVPAPAAAVDSPTRKPVLATLEAELMYALFGKAYDVKRESALAPLPDSGQRTQRTPHVITAVAHTELADGETLLVANALPADDHGAASVGHATPGLLNVFALRKENGDWKVLRRHENIDALGSSGQLGKVKWIQLAKGKPGLAILHGGTWQGSSITILALYDVSGEKVRSMAREQINIESSNDGGCGPNTATCWDVKGTWKFAAGPAGATYDDLLIQFTGKEAKPLEPFTEEDDPEKIERVVKNVKGNARYRFDGKQYKLIQGSNLAPSI